MRLVIPDIPKSPNGKNGTIRTAWYRRPKYSRYWRDLVRSQISQPGCCKERMNVVISQMRRRLLDKDNLYASNKVVLDALKSWHLIFDDSERWIDLDCRQNVGKEKTTIVVIEEV